MDLLDDLLVALLEELALVYYGGEIVEQEVGGEGGEGEGVGMAVLFRGEVGGVEVQAVEEFGADVEEVLLLVGVDVVLEYVGYNRQ